MLSFPNAKINIGLRVINKRSDGYHDLETVFYPIGIRDALEVIVADELKFTSSGIPVPGIAENNLCVKAYNLIARDKDLPPVHIHLHKQIPIGAGLGGGSADAAFFIKMLNEKFGLGFSIDEMENYSRQLGADCAFFIRNKPVLAFEKGDRFEDMELDLSKYYIVLVMPPAHVSTAEAYSKVKPQKALKSLKELLSQPVEEWKNSVVNYFEPSVFEHHPVIAKVKDQLYQAGAIYASMSGSGASVYGIYNSEIKLPEMEQENSVFYGV